MIRDKKKVFTLLLFLSVFFFNLVNAAELNLVINGKINDFNSSFLALTNESAIKGVDSLDVVIPGRLSNESAFYSKLENVHLSVDVWNILSVSQREIYLVFETNPASTGILNLNWNFSSTQYLIYLTDYGPDASYNKKISNQINIKTVSNYSSFFDGIRYFLLNVTYLVPIPPNSSQNEQNSSNFNPEVCNEGNLCGEWGVCNNIEYYFNEGELSVDEYGFLNVNCESIGYDSKSCGFEKRSCEISDQCLGFKPNLLRICEFSENPTCSDNVRNCPGGVCESEIDCGGPCKKCANEESNYIFGMRKILVFIYLMIVAEVFLIVWIIFYIIRFKRIRKKKALEELNWYNFGN